MKGSKGIQEMAIIIVLAICLSACAPRITQEAMLEKAIEQQRAMQNYEARIALDTTIHIGSDSQAIRLLLKTTAFTQPLQYRLTVNMELEGLSYEHNMYLAEMDGVIRLYEDGLESTELPGYLRGYLDGIIAAKRKFAALCLEKMKRFAVSEQPGWIGGRRAVKLMGGFTLGELAGMAQDGGLLALDDVNGSPLMAANSPWRSIHIPVTAYMDDGNYRMIRCEADLSALIGQWLQAGIDSSLGQGLWEDGRGAINIEGGILTIEYTHVNDAEPFTLPQEPLKTA